MVPVPVMPPLVATRARSPPVASRLPTAIDVHSARRPRAVSTSPRATAPPDRKSVGSGQSVSVRVDLGGRRIIQKKKFTQVTQYHHTRHNTNHYANNNAARNKLK